MRVGCGFDAHGLAGGRKLILGGVDIGYERGLAGHSDGDAVLHALIDALLGAAALGDIGTHFPETTTAAGISSMVLLEQTRDALRAKGWRAANVDATIVAQQPRLAPHVGAMRERIASALGLELDEVSVKATTTDHLGFAGREEGIAAFAVATVVPLG